MEEKGELDHYIGVATSSDETGEFDVLKMDACTWAVFESIGPFPETLQNIWGRIYSEWFPSSGYEAARGPEILWNESPDTKNPKYRSEIWIPVKKKVLWKKLFTKVPTKNKGGKAICLPCAVLALLIFLLKDSQSPYFSNSS